LFVPEIQLQIPEKLALVGEWMNLFILLCVWLCGGGTFIEMIFSQNGTKIMTLGGACFLLS